MSDTPIRRTNWTADPQGDESDEPLEELERIGSGFVTVATVTALVFVVVIGALVYSWVGG